MGFRITQSITDDLYWEKHRVYCTFYAKLKHNGLAGFDKNGYAHGYNGKFLMKTLIDYFNELEMFERSAYVKGLLDTLKKRKHDSINRA